MTSVRPVLCCTSWETPAKVAKKKMGDTFGDKFKKAFKLGSKEKDGGDESPLAHGAHGSGNAVKVRQTLPTHAWTCNGFPEDARSEGLGRVWSSSFYHSCVVTCIRPQDRTANGLCSASLRARSLELYGNTCRSVSDSEV